MKSKLSTTKPDPALARWCEVLAAGSATPEEVPPGWFTIVQLSAARGRNESTVGRHVRSMVESGLAEKKVFSIVNGGRVRPVPHYRLK
jgi:hypothetical protein